MFKYACYKEVIVNRQTVNPQIKTGIQLEAGLQIVAEGVVDTDK